MFRPCAYSSTGPDLDRIDLVCWSRMQAEAGQQLDAIVARKELERRANGGLFFWGVGNAPGPEPARLARARVPVRLVLSVMKSKPRRLDVEPEAILVWRRYVDEFGETRPLPGGTLVTSRAPEPAARARPHYALVCRSAEPLSLGDRGAFNARAYRNVGGRGAAVGASQVTALVRLAAPDSTDDMGYRVAIEGALTGGYWVRLADPVRLPRRSMTEALRNASSANPDDWSRLARSMRAEERTVRHHRQPGLFDLATARPAIAEPDRLG